MTKPATTDEPVAKARAMDPAKVRTAINHILGDNAAKALLIEELLKSDLHVFNGMSHMNVVHPDRRANSRTAIVLDTETTGLNHLEDKVIQLSMLKVLYDEHGIVEITEEFFDQFQDPGHPLDPKITQLTGITDAQVSGQKIDIEAAKKFVEGADLIIAHNAAFDRKMVEHNLPEIGFATMNWACSIKDVDWENRHAGSPKLELLVHSQGYVYPAHNAYADCKATAFMLTCQFDLDTETFTDILDTLKRRKVMVMATGLQFGRQEPLKAAGWKWSPDRSGDAGDKCWFITISTPEEAQNAAKSAKEAYGGDVMLPIRVITAENAYSTRLPPQVPNGFHVKSPLKALNAEDIIVDNKNDDEPSFKF